jgi:hypothetical protein
VDERIRKCGGIVSKIIFIADYFLEDLTGGAELNDNTLISLFDSEGLLYEKIRCHMLTENYIINNADKTFIIANFCNLSEKCKESLYFCDYIIYEHDYKFLKSRNPAEYVDFLVPRKDLINVDFYSRAKKIICLCNMHAEIFRKNLNLKNIVNIECSLFDDAKLDLLSELSLTIKNGKNCIINTNNPTKKLKETIQLCKKRHVEFDLISHKDNVEFLKLLSNYSNLFFLTKHPEPTPRIAVECRILNVNFNAPRRMIGVAHEPWWKLRGLKLAEEIRDIRNRSYNKIKEWVSEDEN